jgi:hypothetical protein
MTRSKNGIGRVVAVALGAAIASGTVVVSTAVVADRLEAASIVRKSQPELAQSHQVDRTNKGDALTVSRDTPPSAMLPGCESAFSLPSPESLTRTPSRCMTELVAPATTRVASLY